MTLEEDEQALSLLHEGVDTRIVRSCENVIAARHQSILRYIVPPGMRHLQLRRSLGRQGMVRHSRVLENAEELIVEWTPPDTTDIEQRRVRGQAGPDSRMRVVLRPLQEFRQASPVWLVR